MKLYSDEPGHAEIRALDTIVASAIARVEVPAAIWRKQRIGELDSSAAGILVAAFEADWHGAKSHPPRFTALALAQPVLDGAAALCASPGLRAYDAVQLASALAAREADAVAAFACFDEELRSAAAQRAFNLIP